MITKKYNLINNIGGWTVFVIALVTYWLTLEPTASFWDCGEFIIQADKLEVGHPPGNPIFMLTARFFANFAPSAQYVSLMVNAMSGLLSALTILLLFWTISHLVRRLVVKDNHEGELSLTQYLVIMGSAAVGSLAYTWSDTFWFSAVEGEVYAFSSFCTALVFWLILKWENRADQPGSDRYLILIAYVIGVSIAVHLLNLLCIPAIVLVFAYRKYKDMNLVKSLIALGVSFVIVFLVLYGLVPGFIKVAQQFELLFVNGLHLPFNSGALAYAIVAAGIFIWAIMELSKPGLSAIAKVTFLLAVTISGMLFIGNSVWLGLVLTILLAIFLFTKYGNLLSQRAMNIITWSIAVIFIGYSSYALILIRSSADTPMNQNAPDNVFDLSSYLNREQYGENPLIYGETLYSTPQKRIVDNRTDTLGVTEQGYTVTLNTPIYGTSIVKSGKALYAKGVKGATPHSEYNLLTEDEKNRNAELAERDGDYYVIKDHKPEVKMVPELNMLFPRLYSRQHVSAYSNWVRLDTMPGQLKTVSAIDDRTGAEFPELDTQNPQYNEMTGAVYYPEKQIFKPSFTQNLAYFFNYQLNHMYLRYFMWNFAGRQNDINNQLGELDAGNWISGIPFIDNPRLGDQSLLPDDLGKNNKGHNVYFMLPLILGLIGLVWQSFAGKRGIEQFWVVFFLFFMTGIAIVLYLNQTPNQPRERDYAFAGSFYAYAIWLGMGVAGLAKIACDFVKDKKKHVYCAAGACVLGLAVPLQMVSQTWDDHDRSGRYAARDFAINYLESLEPNAIVFCNGDNDTFPLWYAQEVEGVRPDVRIINLSYLNSDWYANQMRMQAYEGKPVEFTATAADYAYGKNDVTVLPYEDSGIPTDLLSSLKILYAGKSVDPYYGYRMLPGSVVKIPVNKKAVIERGLVAPQDTANIVNEIVIDLGATASYRNKGYLGLGEILMLDIIATNAANGWPRPIYWCSTVGDEYHVGLTPYVRSTGMTHQLVPTMQEGKAPRTDRSYDNIMNKYRWGGADAIGKKPYFDETVRRMFFSVRNSMIETASQLLFEGDALEAEGNTKAARAKYDKAQKILDKMLEKAPADVAPIDLSIGLTAAQIYCELGKSLNNKKLTQKGLAMLEKLMEQNAQYLRYNREISSRFYNPSLTYESRLVPYQYYRIVELYTTYGGKADKAEKILGRVGFSIDKVKELYDLYYSYSDDAGYDADDPMAGYDPKSAAMEAARYCEIANHLAGLSPEEYAGTSEEERYIDSMLNIVLETIATSPEAQSLLEQNEQYQALDKERTKRIGDEFRTKHGM